MDEGLAHRGRQTEVSKPHAVEVSRPHAEEVSRPHPVELNKARHVELSLFCRARPVELILLSSSLQCSSSVQVSSSGFDYA